MAQKSDKKKKNRSIVSRVFHGQVISSDFFTRNWLVIAFAVTFLLAYITSNYTCKTKMEEVRRLKQELEVTKTERERARSIYMGRVRESSMQKMVDSLHLGLHVQDQPAYDLSKK